MKKVYLSLVLLLSCFILPANAAEQAFITMATTTSTDDTGLLEYLKPHFIKDTGLDLRWVAVGTGKALEHGKNGDVDVLLVHAPKAEKEFIEAGFGVDRRQVMYNDYILVGPKEDPAGIRGQNIAAAMKEISAKKAVFVSRGDDSGTHKQEQNLWKAAEVATPDKEEWYKSIGQGMMTTINTAQENKGYTLTDRGTYITYEAKNSGKPELVILVEGDASLRNQYSVIMVNPVKHPAVKIEAAKRFMDWWVSPATQKLIADFKLEGKQLFFPNAEKK